MWGNHVTLRWVVRGRKPEVGFVDGFVLGLVGFLGAILGWLAGKVGGGWLWESELSPTTETRGQGFAEAATLG